MIKKLSASQAIPRLLLDSGNALFKRSAVEQDSVHTVTAQGIMGIYMEMHYDAVAVGPRDLSAGLPFLLQNSPAGFPWLSANLLDDQGVSYFKPYLIKKIGDHTVGIVGLTGSSRSKKTGIEPARWQEVLPRVMYELRKDCDFIILLSSMSDVEHEAILGQFKDVHLLLTADRRKSNVEPFVFGQTVVTQTSRQGKHLAHLSFLWGEGCSWESLVQHPTGTQQGTEANSSSCGMSNTFIALKPNLPDDKKIKSMMQGITRAVKTHKQ